MWSTGQLYCWGRNGPDGALGDGSGQDQFSPVPVGTGEFVFVGLGIAHSCAIDPGGLMSCWGRNENGQLGVGDTQSVPTPVQLPGPQWSRVAGGWSHTCAIKDEGTLWCWGSNSYGELGRTGQPGETQPEPVQVGNASIWIDITAADEYSCGVQSDGTAWCWGRNLGGRLGIGTSDDAAAPTQVNRAEVWTRVAAGTSHTCGLAGGSAFCWGSNLSGQFGDGTSMTGADTPTHAADGMSLLTITTNEGFSCGVAADGTAHCWGFNVSNQLGLGAGAPTRQLIPALVDSGPWLTVAAGREHTCALRDDGTAWCWGDNTDGQLGASAVVDTAADPVPVDPVP